MGDGDNFLSSVYVGLTSLVCIHVSIQGFKNGNFIMNTRKLFLSACSGLLLIFPLSALAVIVDGTFKATVTGSEATANLWGDIYGDTISGTFSYKTDTFESSLTDGNHTKYFNGHNNFVYLTFNIAGQIFDISRDYAQSLEPESLTDVVELRDGNFGAPGNKHDYFHLLDIVYLGSENAGYARTMGEIHFFDNIANVINGTGLEQEFKWVSTGTDDSGGYGTFHYNRGLNASYAAAYVSLDITEVTASKRRAVPEPAPLLLFGTALLGFTLRSRKSFLKSNK